MKTKRLGLIPCMGILGGIIILSLFVPYLNVIALVMGSYMLIRMKKEDMLYLLMFLLPFASIFKLSLDSFVMFHGLVFVALGRLLYLNRMKLKKYYGGWLLILAVYAIVVSITTDIVECIKMLLYLLTAALFLNTKDLNCSFKAAVVSASVGIIVTSILALFSAYLPNLEYLLTSSRIKLSSGQYFYRFTGLTGNPNYYTMMISVVLAAMCVLMIQRKMNLWDYGMFLALSVFGFMTVSKSYIITYVAMLFVLAIILLKKNIRYLGIGILLFGILGVAVYTLLDKDVVTTILYRFSDSKTSDISDLTTNRSEYWLDYLAFFWNHIDKFFIGNGIGAENLNGNASHSFYIEIVYYLGAIGGSLYAVCLNRIFHIFNLKQFKKNYYAYLPWIVFFIRALARNIIMSEQLVFMLALCTLAVSSVAQGETETARQNRLQAEH